MPTKLKKTKSAGRFGARYGRSVRSKLVDVEVKQRKKQICPFCKKLGAKRLSKGIWDCSKCGKKDLEIGVTCSCGGSGYDIENKIMEVVNGQKHTAFRLNVRLGQYQERFHFVNKI